MPGRASRLTVLALLLLAVTGMLVQGGSLPHVHHHDGVGLYNQEHDLTLLAGFAAHALEVDATPAVSADAVAPLRTPDATERPISRLTRFGFSRAPPSA